MPGCAELHPKKGSHLMEKRDFYDPFLRFTSPLMPVTYEGLGWEIFPD